MLFHVTSITTVLSVLLLTGLLSEVSPVSDRCLERESSLDNWNGFFEAECPFCHAIRSGRKIEGN